MHAVVLPCVLQWIQDRRLAREVALPAVFLQILSYVVNSDKMHGSLATIPG